MAYATLQDMQDRFGKAELASSDLDPNMPRGSINEARVQLMLDQASSKIDSYLQRRYSLPLSEPVPVSIKECCCKLARFDLACGSRSSPSDQITAGRKDALQWLSDIGSGKATLDIQQISQKSTSWSQIATRPASISTGGKW